MASQDISPSDAGTLATVTTGSNPKKTFFLDRTANVCNLVATRNGAWFNDSQSYCLN